MFIHPCGATVGQALDAERCALLATIDPHRLTALGEVEALRDGRWTYRLNHGHLTRRDRWNIPGHPPSQQLHVLTDHRCGHPIPATWLAPPLPVPPRPTTTEVQF